MVLLLCAVATNTAQAQAQEIRLETFAPTVVAKGAVFAVEYRIAAQPQRMIDPEFGDAFMLIGTGQHHSVVSDGGGQRTVYTYRYVLIAHETGNFTIPAATAIVDGRTYTSQPKPIEVVEEGATGGGTATAPQSGERPQQQRDAGQITDEDLFLRAVVDKTTVWRGEPVRVRFKLYSRTADLGNEGAKMPTFNGFWSQSLDTQQYRQQTETYNSRVYHTFIVAEYLLYPTQSGALTIDPLTLNMVIREIRRRQSRSILDDFMMMPDVHETRRTVSSPPVTITVRELPAGAPPSFSGAVGNFTMTATQPETTMYVNSAATYRIRIAGMGNIPLLQGPRVEMPASFEMHNVKMTEDTRSSPTGITGSRQFEHPFIARAVGDFTVEPVQFSYFNPQTGEYATLETRRFNLSVMADTTGGPMSMLDIRTAQRLSQEPLRMLDSDIRYIKHDAPGLRPHGRVLMCSVLYFVLAGAIVALFFAAFFYLRRRITQMRDAALMRGKKANKIVLARLRSAEEFMTEGNSRRFHDEMLKALWGYLGDKLNIPAANLTKENVREELSRRGIPADETNRYVELISECEYAQYSPAESSTMHEKYKTAVEIISRMEGRIR